MDTSKDTTKLSKKIHFYIFIAVDTNSVSETPRTNESQH